MPNTFDTLTAVDQTILDVMDHVGLGDTLISGTNEARGYFNEAGAIEGQNEDTIVYDVPTFNLRTADFEALGLELEDEVEIEGRGTFRYTGGPHSAGVGRSLITLGQVDGG